MANLIIKSSADNLVLQGSDASPAITVGATGTTTFAENATMSGVTTLANATITAWTPPAHTIIQVVQGTATAGLELTSTTYVTTGLSAAITPSATSSKILVNYHICYDSDANGTAAQYALYAGGSNIVDKIHYIHGASSRVIGSSSMMYQHSPNTSSAITYELFAKKNSGTRIYTRYADTMSTITLMEIKG
jgi:hypothetical protein